MKPMILTLLEKPQQQLDLSALTPDSLVQAGNKKQIAALKLKLGNKKIAVGELFDITGNDVDNIELRRTTNKVCNIGQGMTRGKITVKAHAGDFLGQKMQGGVIHVHGNCGDWLGCDMHWGKIEIDGDAGDNIGKGSHSSSHGMHDGLITVWGNAGDRIGERMRRGMIMVAGDAGDYIGANMVAGTMLVLGKIGNLPGYGMKRGTIIMGHKPELIGDSMASCGSLKMEYLRLFFKQLSRMGSKYRFFKQYGPEVHRYAGDMANNGKGELLILLNTLKQK